MLRSNILRKSLICRYGYSEDLVFADGVVEQVDHNKTIGVASRVYTNLILDCITYRWLVLCICRIRSYPHHIQMRI